MECRSAASSSHSNHTSSHRFRQGGGAHMSDTGPAVRSLRRQSVYHSPLHLRTTLNGWPMDAEAYRPLELPVLLGAWANGQSCLVAKGARHPFVQAVSRWQ